MHLLSQSSGIVKLLNLTRFLHEPHGDYSFDKLLGGVLPAVLGDRGDLPDTLLRNSYQRGQFHGVVISRRREEMNIPTGRQGL